MTQTLIRPDRDLERAVLEQFRWTTGLDSTHVRVEVSDGVVTVTGKVDSYPEKLLAAKAAAAGGRVSPRRTQCSPRHVPAPGVPPTDLRADIEAALVRCAAADGNGLTVTTDPNGVVEAYGRVNSWNDRLRAENVYWAA